MSDIWILAQAEGESAPTTITSEPVSDEGVSQTKVPSDPNMGGTGAQPKPGLGLPQILLIGVMIFIVFMMFRGPKKKQQEHQKMVKSLQKNDRVRTIGGIYGTIVDVRDDEIVLKIDEANNTKIKVSPNAIGQKVADEKS
ncbi:MAG: preprotein translocase subunit YajC [Sedimentisphaerales bacterium]|nr:preprotein translocase subunit YajC [Sedimentisphaerales bacterium]